MSFRRRRNNWRAPSGTRRNRHRHESHPRSQCACRGSWRRTELRGCRRKGVPNCSGRRPRSIGRRRRPEGRNQTRSNRRDCPGRGWRMHSHGDRLEAGPEAVVTLETTNGVRHVGGQYDPVFDAPEAVEAVAPGVASYVGAFYRNLFAGTVMTAAATGRAASSTRRRKCVPAQEAPSPLDPLDRSARPANGSAPISQKLSRHGNRPGNRIRCARSCTGKKAA